MEYRSISNKSDTRISIPSSICLQSLAIFGFLYPFSGQAIHTALSLPTLFLSKKNHLAQSVLVGLKEYERSNPTQTNPGQGFYLSRVLALFLSIAFPSQPTNPHRFRDVAYRAHTNQTGLFSAGGISLQFVAPHPEWLFSGCAYAYRLQAQIQQSRLASVKIIAHEAARINRL